MEIFKKGAGIAITDLEGRVLLGKRSDGQGWCLAGGKIEPGETSKQAALRELKEEFGIELKNKTDVVSNGYFFGPAIIKGKKQTAISEVYIYQLDTNEKLNFGDRTNEMTEIKWFTFNDILHEDNIFPITSSVLNLLYSEHLCLMMGDKNNG